MNPPAPYWHNAPSSIPGLVQIEKAALTRAFRKLRGGEGLTAFEQLIYEFAGLVAYDEVDWGEPGWDQDATDLLEEFSRPPGHPGARLDLDQWDEPGRSLPLW